MNEFAYLIAIGLLSIVWLLLFLALVLVWLQVLYMKFGKDIGWLKV